jgi:CheY-like chemotaxis protein
LILQTIAESIHNFDTSARKSVRLRRSLCIPKEALIAPLVRSSASASAPQTHNITGKEDSMDTQGTVFYVDDNPKSRELLTGILQATGFTVIAASEPQEALDRARNGEFAIALLDYQMPGMTGTQLARELKRIDPNLPVVLLSGMAALPSYELTFVDAHLGRGTRVDQLLETVQMLAHARMPMTTSTVRWHEST